MLIKKIRLKNFKNFKDAELELSDMNVLVGANASGKSNFLQALKFLKDIQEHGLENAISLQGGMEYLRNINCGEEEAVEIEVEFYLKSEKKLNTYDKHNENIFLSYEVGIMIYKKLIFSLSLKGDDEIRETIFLSGKLQKKLSKLDQLEKFSLKNYEGEYVKRDKTEKRVFKYGNYSILIPIFEFEPYETNIFDKKISITQSLLEINLFPENIFDYSLFDFDLKRIKQPSSIIGKIDLGNDGHNLALVIKKILADEKKARQFSNLISDILPFIKSIETEKFYDKSLLFKIQEKGHTSPIPSSLLSDGTVSVTAILIALFFENNRLTIIEEPEYGIHPSLVSKLVDTFYEAAKNKQIIITTHSSEILKHIKLEDLRLISRDANGFSTVSKPAEKEMVNQFLKNELGINDLFVQNLLDI